MICPHDQSQCFLQRCEKGCADYPVAPPPPTLAEIERLVDAFEFAVDDYRYYYSRSSTRAEIDKAKAALMAAIRAYGRE